MKRYTDKQLIRMLIEDLINDIRCEDSTDSPYAVQLRSDVSTLFKQRHTTRLDRYGWPECLQVKS